MQDVDTPEPRAEPTLNLADSTSVALAIGAALGLEDIFTVERKALEDIAGRYKRYLADMTNVRRGGKWCGPCL